MIINGTYIRTLIEIRLHGNVCKTGCIIRYCGKPSDHGIAGIGFKDLFIVILVEAATGAVPTTHKHAAPAYPV